MGRLYHRPVTVEDWANGSDSGISTVGNGNVLGDGPTNGNGNDATFKRYRLNSGSVGVYGAFNQTIPSGREIIAVRAGHRQRNTGILGLYNGWVSTFLRINGARQLSTRAYKQDGYNDGGREVLGPALYKKDYVPWTLAEINTMSTDSGSAVGDIGPDRDNYWCVCSETFVQVVFDEPLTVPSMVYPASGEVINTSSVSFRVRCPAPQDEQPVRAIIQVARNSAMTQEVQTFEAGQISSTDANAESKYTSIPGMAGYTNLGPGQWFVRTKKRDYRGSDHESGWSAVTSFTVTHSALPTPVLTSPVAGTVSPTPYGIRTATIPTQPSGGRKVGVMWQFAKDTGFTNSVVQWTNIQDGYYTVPTQGAPITYNAEPTGDVEPGKQGRRVSSGDPSQYLAQGNWYARVRAVDAYGQVGPWSTAQFIQVYHPPTVMGSTPQGGVAFDQYAGPVRWQFGDPWDGDVQSKYRVRVIDPLSGTQLFNSGEIVSSLSRATITVPDTYQQKILQLAILVWDADGTGLSGTEYTATFQLAKSPVVTLAYPAVGELITTGQPEISWVATFSGGATQKSYRVRYLRADTGVVAYDSGVILSASTTHTPGEPVLRNLTGYQLELTITDTANLATALLRNFGTNFVRPASVVSYVDADGYSENGYVTVHFPSAQLDPLFFEWRAYRRRKGTEAWTLAGSSQAPFRYEFRDWLLAGTGEWEYSVVQVASRYGSLVESEHDPLPTSIRIVSDSYWFIVPGDEERSVRVRSVVGDKFAGKREENEFVVIGAGLRVNQGSRIGKQGSLSAQVRASNHLSVDQMFEVLEELGTSARPVMMRDPFGNVVRVKIGEMSVDRLPGVGPLALGDIEIPYKEVR